MHGPLWEAEGGGFVGGLAEAGSALTAGSFELDEITWGEAAAVSPLGGVLVGRGNSSGAVAMGGGGGKSTAIAVVDEPPTAGSETAVDAGGGCAATLAAASVACDLDEASDSTT